MPEFNDPVDPGMDAVCHVCGCTEDEPCDGGCTWVMSSLEIELCSACAWAIARDAVADGTYTPQPHEIGTADTEGGASHG